MLDNDYRHPVVLAKELATIDLLSDGRLEIGIGAGWMRTDYDTAGLPYDSAGVRIDRFVEGLAVLKGLMADPPFSFAGKHYTVSDLQGMPKPVQRPHPPILIGGGGRRVLSIAGPGGRHRRDQRHHALGRHRRRHAVLAGRRRRGREAARSCAPRPATGSTRSS